MMVVFAFFGLVNYIINFESSSFQHEFEVDAEQKELEHYVEESQKSKSDSTVWNAKVTVKGNSSNTFYLLHPKKCLWIICPCTFVMLRTCYMGTTYAGI